MTSTRVMTALQPIQAGAWRVRAGALEMGDLNVNDGSLGRRAVDLASPAERAHALGHGGEPETLGRRGRNALAVVAEGKAEPLAPLLAAILARSRLLQNIDGQRERLAVTDGIGDAFLDAAIEREVDRYSP